MKIIRSGILLQYPAIERTSPQVLVEDIHATLAVKYIVVLVANTNMRGRVVDERLWL